ncbi:MAG: 4Fe-4S dicluster domain-containing protein [Chloroflexi bacterium]|nr:4Fe-4S dicluster domain-containing protein [Chloroflexota bacterium]
MKLSRRKFLTLGGGALILVLIPKGIETSLAGTAPETAPSPIGDWTKEWEKHYWGFAVDTTKCIGCGRCVVACKVENRLPPEPEFTRTWVERYVILEDGEVLVDSPEAGMHGFKDEVANARLRGREIRRSFFVPKLCNQCDDPPCVQVCPVAATHRTADGVVLVDRKRCIGCRYCIQACPYGARYLDPEERVADKCTWCYHRIAQGMKPACVEVCPVGARIFGDFKDPESPVRQVLRKFSVGVLKPDLGTKPKVYYIGLQSGVR